MRRILSSSAQNVDQGDLKVDFKATQKDNISYRFTRAYQNNPSNNSQTLLSNGFSSTPIYNTVGDWSRVIGSNLVNDARFGWSHVTVNNGTGWASGVGQFGNTLGIGNGNPGSLPGLLAINFHNAGSLTNLGTTESTENSMTMCGKSKMRSVDAMGGTTSSLAANTGVRSLRRSTQVTTVNWVSWTTTDNSPVRGLEVRVATVALILSLVLMTHSAAALAPEKRGSSPATCLASLRKIRGALLIA